MCIVNVCTGRPHDAYILCQVTEIFTCATGLSTSNQMFMVNALLYEEQGRNRDRGTRGFLMEKLMKWVLQSVKARSKGKPKVTTLKNRIATE